MFLIIILLTISSKMKFQMSGQRWSVSFRPGVSYYAAQSGLSHTSWTVISECITSAQIHLTKWNQSDVSRKCSTLGMNTVLCGKKPPSNVPSHGMTIITIYMLVVATSMTFLSSLPFQFLSFSYFKSLIFHPSHRNIQSLPSDTQKEVAVSMCLLSRLQGWVIMKSEAWARHEPGNTLKGSHF
jgi:hypothetical protein